MTERKIKFDIDNGAVFFADEIGVIHNPLKVIIDFKSITPRIDMRNQEFQPMVLKHNLIMMDPFTAKTLLELLKKNILTYEKQFGKINKPVPLKIASRKSKKKDKSDEVKSPSYFG